ncbi:hypothetical protein GOP47_0019352, partial [Adiantum capillus-veneris]
ALISGKYISNVRPSLLLQSSKTGFACERDAGGGRRVEAVCAGLQRAERRSRWRRKRHGLEEEAAAVAAERIRKWARIVRPHGSLWTVELQRTLIAMAVSESTRDAEYALMWQQRCMHEQ